MNDTRDLVLGALLIFAFALALQLHQWDYKLTKARETNQELFLVIQLLEEECRETHAVSYLPNP